MNVCSPLEIRREWKQLGGWKGEKATPDKPRSWLDYKPRFRHFPYPIWGGPHGASPRPASIFAHQLCRIPLPFEDTVHIEPESSLAVTRWFRETSSQFQPFRILPHKCGRSFYGRRHLSGGPDGLMGACARCLLLKISSVACYDERGARDG